MLPIKVDSDISLKVLNYKKDYSDLDWRAFFVAPHGKDSNFLTKLTHLLRKYDNKQDSQKEVSILYGGVYGLLKFTSRGVVENSYGFVSEVVDIERFEFGDKSTIPKSVDPVMYYTSHLIKYLLTRDRVPIVVVENKNYLPLKIIRPRIENAYKQLIISTHNLSEIDGTLDKYQQNVADETWRRLRELDYHAPQKTTDEEERRDKEICQYFGDEDLVQMAHKQHLK
jgi:hypothetical protein